MNPQVPVRDSIEPVPVRAERGEAQLREVAAHPSTSGLRPYAQDEQGFRLRMPVDP
jgi:hypothetical protein